MTPMKDQKLSEDDTTLHHVVFSEYYELCPVHKKYLNMYCLACNTTSADCQKCIQEKHQKHNVIQIRRNTNAASIDKSDVKRYFRPNGLDGLQLYKINGRFVYFLRCREYHSRNKKEAGKVPCKMCKRLIKIPDDTCCIECHLWFTKHPITRLLPPFVPPKPTDDYHDEVMTEALPDDDQKEGKENEIIKQLIEGRTRKEVPKMRGRMVRLRIKADKVRKEIPEESWKLWISLRRPRSMRRRRSGPSRPPSLAGSGSTAPSSSRVVRRKQLHPQRAPFY